MGYFTGRTAVITGAGSGFGLEASRIAAREGMNVVMADVMPDPLAKAAAEIEGLGAKVLPFQLDVSNPGRVQALADATVQRFGAPHFVFNNAGISVGGLIWEHTLKDWEWTVGVNLMGVAHGVRIFTPLMLEAAKKDPAYQGHIVNTASMAGLVTLPNQGAYNVTKHGVVAMSETLYQDLALVTEQVHAHVLCPYFVPTGIIHSDRARPGEMRDADEHLTPSQKVAKILGEKAVASGKVSAAEVAQYVFDAMQANRFYVFSHPNERALGPVAVRAEDIVKMRNPTDPFAHRPDLGAQLRAALKG
ncbi:MAG TPA: SDR family oxidoreductase [Ideonella sp.]|jgi:NAD(P)-dependent dehydrogenase (short-subunit alcohol dehydrogenase family)|nr:SDR family oxidoreductase [Ideonella sp.]